MNKDWSYEVHDEGLNESEFDHEDFGYGSEPDDDRIMERAWFRLINAGALVFNVSSNLDLEGCSAMMSRTALDRRAEPEVLFAHVRRRNVELLYRTPEDAGEDWHRDDWRLDRQRET